MIVWRILRAAVELIALAAFLYMFLLIAFILI
jgi:hypothetical protein